jgi:hypothetical protein
MVFLKVNVICRIRPADQIWSTLILDGDGIILDSCATLQKEYKYMICMYYMLSIQSK